MNSDTGLINSRKTNNLKDKKLQHHYEIIIFRDSTYILSKAEKYLYLRGLDFSILITIVNYLVDFELLYRDIRNLNVVSAKDLDFIKTKTIDIALSSFRTRDNNVPQ